MQQQIDPIGHLVEIPNAKLARSEWITLAALIDGWWPATEFTKDMEATWWPELARYTADEIEWALRVCRLEGSDFAPSLGHVEKYLKTAAQPDVQLPSFDYVLERLQWALRRHGSAIIERRDTDHRGAQAMIRDLAGEHAAISDFALQYGVDRLAREPMGGPGDGKDVSGAVLARLEKAWKSFSDGWEDRQVRNEVAAQVAAKTEARELRAGTRQPRQLGAAATAHAAIGRVPGTED